MKISILGTGYVGLTTAVGLANSGKEVICIDRDLEKISKIEQGVSPIYEPGLESLLQKNQNRIEVTSDANVVKETDVVIIAVGTPFDGSRIDLSYIRQAALEIGQALKGTAGFRTVVVKSTVIPETTLKVVRPIVMEASGKPAEELGFCMNPEFLREGNAVEDFLNPDRIVLGVSCPQTEAVMRQVYDGFPDTDILVANPTTAEMIKYTANSFLALTISYANEIARVCERLPGVDSEEVFQGVIYDKRFSPIIEGQRIVPQLSTYLRAGIGFGGSCFPKDVKALQAFASDLRVDGKLLSGLLHINQTQLEHVFRMGLNCHPDTRRVKRIAILGTAFKPNTDDIRESPGIKLAKMALSNGYQLAVQDYIALPHTKAAFGTKVQYFEDPLAAIREADIVYITTIWPQYKDISDEDFKRNLKTGAVVVDTRSLYKDRAEQPWRIRVGVGNSYVAQQEKKKKNKLSEMEKSW